MHSLSLGDSEKLYMLFFLGAVDQKCSGPQHTRCNPARPLCGAGMMARKSPLQHPGPTTPSEVGRWCPAWRGRQQQEEEEERIEEGSGAPPHPRREGLKQLGSAPHLDCTQGVESLLGENASLVTEQVSCTKGRLSSKYRPCSFGLLSLYRERTQVPSDLLGKMQ